MNAKALCLNYINIITLKKLWSSVCVFYLFIIKRPCPWNLHNRSIRSAVVITVATAIIYQFSKKGKRLFGKLHQLLRLCYDHAFNVGRSRVAAVIIMARILFYRTNNLKLESNNSQVVTYNFTLYNLQFFFLLFQLTITSCKRHTVTYPKTDRLEDFLALLTILSSISSILFPWGQGQNVTFKKLGCHSAARVFYQSRRKVVVFGLYKTL